MINAEKLLSNALRRGLTGRRRSGLASLARGRMGGILGVGALGLAIAAYDHFSRKQTAAKSAAATSVPPPPPRTSAPPPPPPPSGKGTELGSEALLLVRAMAAAAQADGKDSFLCAAKGVQIGIFFQRKILTGLFGGEGFIMQKLEGDGLVFVHAGGCVYLRELGPADVLQADTGCVVAFQDSVGFDIQKVGGIKSALFGGEGLFFATLRGPGKVWLQSLPFSRLAGRMLMAAPKGGGKRVGEGSILGGLGDLLGGDNR